MEKQPSRLGECEVCGARDAKYTCPKCEVKTCTLKCVNIHKKELECDGIRDKTRYVPLSQFTNLDLLSDYRLLEDATRTVENLKTDTLKKHTRIGVPLPQHLFRLKNCLRDRNTFIEFLPANFARHKENTTKLNFKTGLVSWRIEWIFSQANNLKIVDKQCDETLKLSTVVKKYLDPDKYESDSLKFYQSLGLSGLNFYLKAEMKSGEKYFILDPSLSIKENLERKKIIEFPTIIVAFKEHSHMFQTIDDSDEEMEEETMTPAKYVSNIVNKEEKLTEKRSGNLLFNSEYSDLEISDDEM